MAGERISDEHLALWQEQAERERKRNPADRAQVDLDSYIAMLAEIRRHRAAALTKSDVGLVRTAIAMLRESKRGCVQNAEYVEKCVAVLDKLLANGGCK